MTSSEGSNESKNSIWQPFATATVNKVYISYTNKQPEISFETQF